jgi:hypothetical protein
MGWTGFLMTDRGGLMLRVRLAADGDVEELVKATGRLRAELLELDVARVEAVSDSAPEGAKGLGELVGWLMLQLGTMSGLPAVVDTARAWARRSDREVEISYGGDVLRVTGVSSAQQVTSNMSDQDPPVRALAGATSSRAAFMCEKRQPLLTQGCPYWIVSFPLQPS